jgi:NitT/TauT family transport system substrate-binding protein
MSRLSFRLRSRLLPALASAALLAGTTLASAQTAVRFSLDWKWEGPSAPFIVAKEKGYFKAEGLDVTMDAGNGSREVIPRVASGVYDIGSGELNSLVRFRDENPGNDVKAVMVIYDRPPFSIIGRADKGITKELSSLQGKKFGAPAPDGAYAQWPVFKAINKIDDSTMKFENVGFPVREAMLASGDVDAVFGFSISSYINLLGRGLQPKDLTMILMADYGLELYGNAILVSPKFLAEKPDAVKGFLRAYIKGMRDTVADPAAAIDLLLKYNDVAKKDTEVARLKMAIEQLMVTPWVQKNGYGDIDPARFEKSLDQLAIAVNFKQKPKPAEIFVRDYLAPAADRMVK